MLDDYGFDQAFDDLHNLRDYDVPNDEQEATLRRLSDFMVKLQLIVIGVKESVE